jgi:hypothetical protein
MAFKIKRFISPVSMLKPGKMIDPGKVNTESGTTGDPVMDAYHAKQKRKKEFSADGNKNKVAKTTEIKGKAIDSNNDVKVTDVKIKKKKEDVKPTGKDKIKAGKALKKEGRKQKRSERKDARLEKRITRATKKGKEALKNEKVHGKGSKSLEMRKKVDRLKAKKSK